MSKLTFLQLCYAHDKTKMLSNNVGSFIETRVVKPSFDFHNYQIELFPSEMLTDVYIDDFDNITYIRLLIGGMAFDTVYADTYLPLQKIYNTYSIPINHLSVGIPAMTYNDIIIQIAYIYPPTKRTNVRYNVHRENNKIMNFPALQSGYRSETVFFQCNKLDTNNIKFQGALVMFLVVGTSRVSHITCGTATAIREKIIGDVYAYRYVHSLSDPYQIAHHSKQTHENTRIFFEKNIPIDNVKLYGITARVSRFSYCGGNSDIII
jgi:hypothetical protein